MVSLEKRCLYEVLGLSRDCSADEIRSAYKKLALQRHPDKLVQAGVSEAEATAAFQELVNAYEVLSDPRERAWYDSHRSQILFSSSNPSNSSNSVSVPNLFSFFSNSVYFGYSDSAKGFYKVYGDLFDKVYQNELNFAKKLGLGMPKEAPLMGNLESPYAQVTAFYNYWLGFVTVMDFCWVDQYDVMAGPNRKSRRVMEDENKKLRKKARREYNETVRGLAEFVKKRDKRVIDMQMKRNEEIERKREEERKKKKELEIQKAERARKYEEPEWAKVEEMEDEDFEVIEEDVKKEDGKELYCVVCGKKFKSEKQWKNHEQSKKHKEKVAELKEAFDAEDEEFKGTEVDGGNKDNEKPENGNGSSYFSADEFVDDLRSQFEDSVRIHGEDTNHDEVETSEDDVHGDIDNGGNTCLESDDDETSILEAMVSGHKSRGKVSKTSGNKVGFQDNDDEMDFMEYNNLKGTRRNRGSRRQRGRRNEEESRRADTNNQAEERSGQDNSSPAGESSLHSFLDNENNGRGDDPSESGHKPPKQAVDKKGTTKKDFGSKSQNTSKGRKQKGAAKAPSNICDACGVEFESRNKLHKHLGDTGHATLKHR